METIKSRIGLAVVCITAVAIADGGNVVSFEKTFAAKDSAEVSAGTCAASIGTERLADARSVGLCNEKMDKCIGAANTRLHGAKALAADSSMTLLKSMPDGGKITSNQIEKSEPLKMPSLNENDITMSKSLDFRGAGDSDNRIAGRDGAMAANMAEMSFAKTIDTLAK